jgi:hypothetical protein
VDSRERTVRRFIRTADDDKTFDLRAMEDLLGRTKGHEIDAYWADHRFGVELDVFGTHGSRLSFEEDGNGMTSCCSPGSPAGAGDRAAARPRTRGGRRVGPAAPGAPERRVKRQSPPRPPSQKKGFGARSP